MAGFTTPLTFRGFSNEAAYVEIHSFSAVPRGNRMIANVRFYESKMACDADPESDLSDARISIETEWVPNSDPLSALYIALKERYPQAEDVE